VNAGLATRRGPAAHLCHCALPHGAPVCCTSAPCWCSKVNAGLATRRGPAAHLCHSALPHGAPVCCTSAPCWCSKVHAGLAARKGTVVQLCLLPLCSPSRTTHLCVYVCVCALRLLHAGAGGAGPGGHEGRAVQCAPRTARPAGVWMPMEGAHRQCSSHKGVQDRLAPLADTHSMPCQCAWKLVGWGGWEARPTGSVRCLALASKRSRRGSEHLDQPPHTALVLWSCSIRDLPRCLQQTPVSTVCCAVRLHKGCPDSSRCLTAALVMYYGLFKPCQHQIDRSVRPPPFPQGAPSQHTAHPSHCVIQPSILTMAGKGGGRAAVLADGGVVKGKGCAVSCVHASLNASTHASDADAPSNTPAFTKHMHIPYCKLSTLRALGARASLPYISCLCIPSHHCQPCHSSCLSNPVTHKLHVHPCHTQAACRMCIPTTHRLHVHPYHTQAAACASLPHTSCLCIPATHKLHVHPCHTKVAACASLPHTGCLCIPATQAAHVPLPHELPVHPCHPCHTRCPCIPSHPRPGSWFPIVHSLCLQLSPRR